MSNSPSTLPALHHWLLVVLLLVETLAESAVVALQPGLTAGSAQRPSLRLAAAHTGRSTALALQTGAAQPAGRAGGLVSHGDGETLGVVTVATLGAAPGVRLHLQDPGTHTAADTLAALPDLHLLLSPGHGVL